MARDEDQSITKKDLNELEDRVISGVAQLIANQTEHIDSIDTKLNRLENKVDGIDTRLERVERKLDQTIERVDVQGQKISKLERKTV